MFVTSSSFFFIYCLFFRIYVNFPCIGLITLPVVSSNHAYLLFQRIHTYTHTLTHSTQTYTHTHFCVHRWRFILNFTGFLMKRKQQHSHSCSSLCYCVYYLCMYCTYTVDRSLASSVIIIIPDNIRVQAWRLLLVRTLTQRKKRSIYFDLSMLTKVPCFR